MKNILCWESQLFELQNPVLGDVPMMLFKAGQSIPNRYPAFLSLVTGVAASEDCPLNSLGEMNGGIFLM